MKPCASTFALALFATAWLPALPFRMAAAQDAPAVELPPLDPQKFTVCTITINSTQEREVFQKHLPAKDFQFIELTELGTPEGPIDEWFENACRSGLQCDMLVISGHFGNQFFSTSGSNHTLPLRTLERHSCSRSCTGILSKPREAFLFGCNTLATKQKDDRSPEEYIRILMRDGFSASEAEQIAEGRYGAFGPQNRERMRRAFQEVPHLYGFEAVGPSGKNVEAKLTRYLKSFPDYAAYLAKDAVKQLTHGVYALNRQWTESLAGTARAQCSGINPQDPNYADHQRICSLFDTALPVAERLATAEGMLKGDRWRNFLPSVENFFRDLDLPALTGAEAEALSRIRKNAAIQEKVLSAVRQMRTPTLRLEWAEFARGLGWLTEAEYARLARDTLLGLLKPRLAREDMETLCGLPDEVVKASGVSARHIPPAYYRSEYGLGVVNCLGLGTRSVEVRKKLLETLTQHGALSDAALGSAFSAVRNSRASSLDAELAAKDPKIQSELESQLVSILRTRKLPEEPFVAGLRALGSLGAYSPATFQLLGSVITGTGAIKPTPAQKSQAISALEYLGDIPEELLLSVERALDDPDFRVQAAVKNFLPTYRGAIRPAFRGRLLDRLQNPARRCDACLAAALRDQRPAEIPVDRLVGLLNPLSPYRSTVARWLEVQGNVPEALLPEIIRHALGDDPETSGPMRELLNHPEIASRIRQSPELQHQLNPRGP